MRCPRCSDQTLATLTHDQVEIERCAACQGIWLDASELEKLLAAAPRELLVDDRRFTPTNLPGPKLPCPSCLGGQLIKLNSRARPGTIVDSCTVCYGTWLDAGELARLSHRDLWSWLAKTFGG